MAKFYNGGCGVIEEVAHCGDLYLFDYGKWDNERAYVIAKGTEIGEDIPTLTPDGVEFIPSAEWVWGSYFHTGSKAEAVETFKEAL